MRDRIELHTGGQGLPFSDFLSSQSQETGIAVIERDTQTRSMGIIESSRQLPLGFVPEEDEEGIGMCSKISREIMAFWGRRIPQGQNRALLENYYKKNFGYIREYNGINMPENANFLDIFLSSNTLGGAIYGHRAVAQKIDNTWFVYDPYLDPTRPLEIHEYISLYKKEKGGEILKIHVYE